MKLKNIQSLDTSITFYYTIKISDLVEMRNKKIQEGLIIKMYDRLWTKIEDSIFNNFFNGKIF